MFYSLLERKSVEKFCGTKEKSNKNKRKRKNVDVKIEKCSSIVFRRCMENTCARNVGKDCFCFFFIMINCQATVICYYATVVKLTCTLLKVRLVFGII